MVEPLRSVLDREEDAGTYKPLALMAVAAIVVSVLFSGLVITLTIVGFFTRQPVLAPWLIVLAFTGILLSIAGRWQISLSEGTREGRRLTAIAWWVSLIGGCIYGAYYYGNVTAIYGQAREFVHTEWLKRMQEGKFDEAFLLTTPPHMRKGMPIKEIEARMGDVVAPFKLERLPRLIERADGKVEIVPLGAATWQQTADGLEVITRFKIVTREGEFEALICAVGNVGRDRRAREWYIKRQVVSVKPISLSEFGILMAYLTGEAEQFMSEFAQVKSLSMRRPEMYLDTLNLSRDQRGQKYREFLAHGYLAPNLLGLTAPPGAHGPASLLGRMRRPDIMQTIVVDRVVPPARSADWLGRRAVDPWMRGYVNMNRALIRWVDDPNAKPPLGTADKEQMLPGMFDPGVIQMSQAQPGPDSGKTRIEVLPDQLRASMIVDVLLPAPGRYRCKGRVVAVCTDAQIVAEVNSRKDAIGAGANEAAVRAMWMSMRHEWRIVEVIIDLKRDLSDMRPGGGPAMMQMPPMGPMP